MTEQQAIKRIKDEIGWESSELNREAFEMGIKALEEAEKLRHENKALKNRCYILTRGTLCLFCPIDCSDREVNFRGNEDAE